MLNDPEVVKYTLNAQGDVVKPDGWTGSRRHPGQLQTAYSNLIAARTELLHALDDYSTLQLDLESQLTLYQIALSVRDVETGRTVTQGGR